MDIFDQVNFSDVKKQQESSDAGTASQDLLAGLNGPQKQAVQHDQGPLLILAGAGSGKTRVITHRIAWLISCRGVRPHAILAITFTNKAADEMKTRIADLIGSMSQSMWVGTFHAMMMRILRRYAERIGYGKSFTILDSDDQQRVIKACLKDLNFDTKMMAPRAVHGQISSAKNALIEPDEFMRQAGSDVLRSKVAEVYRSYQKRLKQNNCMDFDDILLESVRLLKENPDVLQEYQQRFEYILVDEYQDTNHAQYQLVHLLSAAHKNLCVVGDDDQSIYSFRGANIQNILDFEKDFKSCRVIKLEQNYRSTQTILSAANEVIQENRGRKAKALWTKHGDGEKIVFLRADDHGEESRYIAREIDRLVASEKESYGGIAILYRVNALSRNLEAALREQGIPYRIYGGTRFYDRKEIKDVLAYLRLMMTPEDEIAFSRIINVPRRGIGEVTMNQIAVLAQREGVTQLEICRRAQEYPELARVATRLTGFASLMNRLKQMLTRDEMTFGAFIDQVEEQTGLLQDIIDRQQKDGREDVVDRIENLKELISDALEFEQNLQSLRMQPEEERQPEDADLHQAESLEGVLRAYLEQAALYADMDQDTSERDFVRLLTIHSAKGLEFDTVFLVGTEEGLFPGYRARESETQMEEERRLAYVAITRARKKLYVTTARSRLVFGQTLSMPVAHFIQAISDEHFEEIGGPRRTTPQAGSSGHASSGGMPSTSRHQGMVFPGQKPRKSSAMAAESRDVDPSDFMAGVKVRHEKFGVGKILESLPVAEDAILRIDFQDAGTKRMLAKSPQLELMEEA